MKCEKCGQITESASELCPNCGEKIEIVEESECCKTNNKKKTILICAGIATSVVLIVIIAGLFIGGIFGKKDGVDEAIERFIDISVYFECDKDKIMAMAPSQFWRAADIMVGRGEAYRKVKEELEMERKLKDTDPYWKKLKVDWEINYLTTLSVEECRNIEKEIESKHGIEYSAIDEAYSFTLEVELTFEEEVARDDVDLYAIKMDDNWYLAYIEEGYRDNDDEICWVIENFMWFLTW